jgi:hypothetical protein
MNTLILIGVNLMAMSLYIPYLLNNERKYYND